MATFSPGFRPPPGLTTDSSSGNAGPSPNNYVYGLEIRYARLPVPCSPPFKNSAPRMRKYSSKRAAFRELAFHIPRKISPMTGINLFEDRCHRANKRRWSTHKRVGGHGVITPSMAHVSLGRCKGTYDNPVLTVLLKNILRRSQGGMSACIALRTTRR